MNSVALVVTEHFGDGAARTDRQEFVSPNRLDVFLVALKAALENERELFPWEEFDLTLDGESALQLEAGLQLAHLWRTQPAELISFDDIYELNGYSGRIEGIGAAKPIYVPVCQRDKKDESEEAGWLPSDLTPMVKVTLQGHKGEVLIPLTKAWVEEFDDQITKAERDGQAEVTNASLPTPVATSQARTLADAFKSMVGAQERIKGDVGPKRKDPKGPRQTLLVKTNFHKVDYLEERRESLALPDGWKADLPRCIRPEIQLKQHQLYGVVANQVIELQLENGDLIVSTKIAHPNQIIPIVRYWIPHIRIISPEGMQIEMEKGLNQYLDTKSNASQH